MEKKSREESFARRVYRRGKFYSYIPPVREGEYSSRLYIPTWRCGKSVGAGAARVIEATGLFVRDGAPRAPCELCTQG